MDDKNVFDLKSMSIVFEKTTLPELNLVEYELKSFNLPALDELRKLPLFDVDLKAKTLYEKTNLFYMFTENMLSYAKFSFPNYIESIITNLRLNDKYTEKEFENISSLFSTFKKTLIELNEVQPYFDEITL